MAAFRLLSKVPILTTRLLVTETNSVISSTPRVKQEPAPTANITSDEISCATVLVMQCTLERLRLNAVSASAAPLA